MINSELDEVRLYTTEQVNLLPLAAERAFFDLGDMNFNQNPKKNLQYKII
jgi:hypothetical protein